MNYKAAVPEKIEQKVAGFGLTGKQKACLFDTIDRDLTSLERLNGYSILYPVQFHTHRIVFTCPETGEHLRYLLWIDTATDPGIRVVKEIAQITDSRPYAGLIKPADSGRRLPTE